MRRAIVEGSKVSQPLGDLYFSTKISTIRHCFSTNKQAFWWPPLTSRSFVPSKTVLLLLIETFCSDKNKPPFLRNGKQNSISYGTFWAFQTNSARFTTTHNLEKRRKDPTDSVTHPNRNQNTRIGLDWQAYGHLHNDVPHQVGPQDSLKPSQQNVLNLISLSAFSHRARPVRK